MYDLSNKNIEILKDLIMKIEKFTGKWYEVDNLFYVSVNELADKTMYFLYKNNMINSSNCGTQEEIINFFENNDPKKYNNLNREYVLKLLTAVARNDRFCTGAWGDLFESGTALILLKKLLETYEIK